MSKRSKTVAGFTYPSTVAGINLMQKSIQEGVVTDLKHFKVLRRFNLVVVASAYEGYYHAALGVAQGEIDHRLPSEIDDQFDDFGVLHRVNFPSGFGKIYRIPHSIAVPTFGFTLPVVEDVAEALLGIGAGRKTAVAA